MEIPSSSGRYAGCDTWADVSPVFVDDGGKVTAIQYTAPQAEALSYFRAILASGERSERVLELTGDMIKYNQADYTAWQVRWQCVVALSSTAVEEGELAFCQAILHDNAKNYQLWNHRRKLALRRWFHSW